MRLFLKDAGFEAFERIAERRLSSQPPWPVPRPRIWVDVVNQPQREAEREAIRRSVLRDRPHGDEGWVQKTAKQLGLESTLRSRGRPQKGRVLKRLSHHVN